MKELFQRPVVRITAAFVAVLLALILYGIYQIFVPLDSSAQGKQEIKVTTGQGPSVIAQTLKDQSIIRSEFFFKLYARLSGRDKNLKAGRYLLSPAFSTAKIVSILSQGLAESEDVEVVIPEGSNVWEVDKRLFEAGLLARTGDFARVYQKDEGYLFPDTYRFDLGLKTETNKDKNSEIIANTMKANFFAKAGNRDRDIIIIASMLEKEGKRDVDMEIIAGIIKRRMALKMLLEIDATVGYGWCLKRFRESKFSKDCDVTQAPIATELIIDGPYNTYLQKGLPVGPISNPGLKAMNAASNPRESEYLYYLSSRDGSQIIYAKTFPEHVQNRKKYLGL